MVAFTALTLMGCLRDVQEGSVCLLGQELNGADRALNRRGVDDLGTHTIARRMIHFGVLTLGLTTAVTNLGFNLSAILAAGAVLGVGIGFALQNVAQNFISGLLLLFERSIKPGDILEVEGRVVRVEDLRIRATVARTRFAASR